MGWHKITHNPKVFPPLDEIVLLDDGKRFELGYHNGIKFDTELFYFSPIRWHALPKRPVKRQPAKPRRRKVKRNVK